MLGRLLLAVAVVFVVNLLPAFGPPTWAVLVYFRFRYGDIPVPALIVCGALASTAGRCVLALAFRAFGSKLPAERRESLELLGRAIGGNRKGLIAGFTFFVVSPIPSAQMFEAAGIARISLKPILAAFFLGRLISYSIYVTGASAAHNSLRHLFSKGWASPQAIAVQLVAIAALIITVKVDWPSTIDRIRAWWAVRHGQPKPAPIRDRLLAEPTGSTAGHESHRRQLPAR